MTARPGGPSYAQARRDQFRVLTVRDGDRAIAARSLHPVRGWAHGMVWACRSHGAVAPSCRAGGWLRAAARRWVCRDASAGIKGLAVGVCQTRRMPRTTPLWTLPTPRRERPRCCVTRAAFSAASTSSRPAWQTPQLPPSDPSAKHATPSRGSSQNWCMRSTPSVAPPSKRCAGVASTSPRDGVVRAARNRSREHHGGLHRQVNTPPNGRTAKIRPKGGIRTRRAALRAATRRRAADRRLCCGPRRSGGCRRVWFRVVRGRAAGRRSLGATCENPRVDARATARSLSGCGGRAAVGAACFAAPELTTRVWSGDDADRTGARPARPGRRPRGRARRRRARRTAPRRARPSLDRPAAHHATQSTSR